MFRKTEEKDLKVIDKIFEQGRQSLNDEDIPQWQAGNYPNIDIVREDMKKDSAYVWEQNSEIAATGSITFEINKKYEALDEGEWINRDGGYAVINRIAANKDVEGDGYVAKLLESFKDLAREKNVKSIRIDTHKKNQGMRSLLEGNDFIYCGIVYALDKPETHPERVVYEHIIEDNVDNKSSEL